MKHIKTITYLLSHLLIYPYYYLLFSNYDLKIQIQIEILLHVYVIYTHGSIFIVNIYKYKSLKLFPHYSYYLGYYLPFYWSLFDYLKQNNYYL